jgi:CCR4-NOT transcription complex subunit 9
MSINKKNNSIQKLEKENTRNIENEEELIIKYTEEIKNEETRLEAIKNLYKFGENNKNIAIYLWYTTGTMAALLQEILNSYQYLSSSKFKNEDLEKTKYILSLLKTIALNKETRKEFLESQILAFLYPFLRCKIKKQSVEVIKVSALGVIAALVTKEESSEVIDFLIKTEIIPDILRIMEKGNELIRAVTCFIVQRIIDDSSGLNYICQKRERLCAVIYVLNTIIQNKTSPRVIKYILKIYNGLIGNKDAKNLIKQNLPKRLKDQNFTRSLDKSSSDKVTSLINSLEEEEQGTDIKIMKLKIDLTNKNNNMQSINILNNNYNNGNQMNLNNSDMNMNNNKNINMMFMNNINQMKLQSGFMISPPVGDFNYNICNDNENYMNSNLYNQHPINGFGNINYYNTYKNS